MKATSPIIAVSCWLITLAALADEPTRREWTVDGVTREGLVAAPASAKTSPAPVIFAFHGHGGTTRHAARTMPYYTLWPEAIVVYLQGLNTPGHITDPDGKRTGWQRTAGDQNDRDLKFFDAALASLKSDYKVDDRRIYSTGHSNGGAFTYLLWAQRGEVLAAVAPSAAPAGRSLRGLKPKPVLHVAGEQDPLVKFEWQKNTIDALRKLNGCDEQGKPAGEYLTLYASKTGTPVLTMIHPGKHNFLAAAPAAIVKFFKEHKRP